MYEDEGELFAQVEAELVQSSHDSERYVVFHEEMPTGEVRTLKYTLHPDLVREAYWQTMKQKGFGKRIAKITFETVDDTELPDDN